MKPGEEFVHLVARQSGDVKSFHGVLLALERIRPHCNHVHMGLGRRETRDLLTVCDKLKKENNRHGKSC